MRILTDATRYAADHGGATFVRPLRLPPYNATIADDATTVIPVCAESAHQAKLDGYASFEAAKCGVAKFLREVIDEVWYKDLKDADTFYTKVTAHKIIAFLDANSGGLHAIDMISLRTSRRHPPVHQHVGGCTKKGDAGWHAHRQRRARDDGLSSHPRGPTLPVQG
jgi:hypothetical protein